MICSTACAVLLSTLPQPPNPWAGDVWTEMTRPSLWRVWGDTPEERCILEIGDDAWMDGKVSAPVECPETILNAFATEPGWWSQDAVGVNPIGIPSTLPLGYVRTSTPSDRTPGTTTSGAGFGFDDMLIEDTFPRPGQIEVPVAVPLPMSAGMFFVALISLFGLRRRSLRPGCVIVQNVGLHTCGMTAREAHRDHHSDLCRGFHKPVGSFT